MANEEVPQKFVNPASPDLIKLYANGFVLGHTAADMYLIGQSNGVPLFTLNMSFTTAKSLRIALEKLVNDFEKDAEIKIHTMEDITKEIAKKQKK